MEINPTEFYSPRKLVRMNVVPWSAMTFNQRLTEDKWRNLFNPMIDIRKGKTFMFIKGEAIIKFLEMVKNGQINNL